MKNSNQSKKRKVSENDLEKMVGGVKVGRDVDTILRNDSVIHDEDYQDIVITQDAKAIASDAVMQAICGGINAKGKLKRIR